MRNKADRTRIRCAPIATPRFDTLTQRTLKRDLVETVAGAIWVWGQGIRGRLDRINSMPDRHDPPAAPPVVRPTPDDGQGAVVAERRTQKTEPPPMYQVVLLNDDYTPMEFVVFVLQEYFKHDLETATQIMLKIHHDGRGVCGVYTKDVAATKVELVLAAARRGGHPLQCIMEAA